MSLTQSELAEKAQMSRARVSDIECGKGPFNMESIFCWRRPWGLTRCGFCRRESKKQRKYKLSKHIVHSPKNKIQKLNYM